MPTFWVSILLFTVLLLWNVGFTQGWSSSSIFLAKTSETFKLADLQYTEARLQATLNNYTVSRLLLDRSTGSSLLQLDNIPIDVSPDRRTTTFHGASIPSSLRQCDWILQVIGSAETGDELLDMLRRMDREQLTMMIDQGWVLDYVRLENAASTTTSGVVVGPTTPKDDGYTMRTLLCSVAQALPTIPALDPQQRNGTLLLVDARNVSGSENRLFFGRLCDWRSTVESSSMWDPNLASRWIQRPFQYSSAINRKTAEIIVDWLCDATKTTDDDHTSPLLLDPTCGSGTFLALALERDFQVVGYDINPQCVQGTRQNLVHMFGEERVHDGHVTIDCMDSSSNHPCLDSREVQRPSCVVANLPWGVNTAIYMDQNIRILQTLHKTLTPGTPCAFVTKHSDPSLFDESGFHIIAQAQIPPVGFKLPKTTKKDKVDDIDPRNGRNSCVVTFASSK